MLLRIQQDQLDKYINVVEKALPGRTTLPVLKGILMETGNDFLRLCASNLELSIQVITREIEIEEMGSVVLPEKFADIVHQLPGDYVTISMHNPDMRVEISSGRSLFNLYGMDALEFPRITTESDWNAWEALTFSASDLKEMIKKIAFAISHDERRPLFRAVYFKLEYGGKLTAIATDTYRLARLQRYYRNDSGIKPFTLLIPGRTLNEIMKIIEDKDGEEIKCFFKENEIIFKYRDYIFSSRLIEGKFPEVDGVFPEGFKTRIRVGRRELEKLLQRAVLLASGQNQMIMLQIKENILQVHVSSDTGRMNEQLGLTDKSGEDLENILLNARYLMDPLRMIEEEEIFIEFNGSLGPCIICLDSGKEDVKDVYRYLVLPIKTEKHP